jgi:hypothetical protein
MPGQELLRKLIVKAPPDLVAAIYTLVRRGREVQGEGPSWKEIVRAAQDLGIFTPDEGVEFIKLVTNGPLEPPPHLT